MTEFDKAEKKKPQLGKFEIELQKEIEDYKKTLDLKLNALKEKAKKKTNELKDRQR